MHQPTPNNPLLFKQKYRIPATRLQGKNYAESGSYFITICSKNRVPWFGQIRNGNMYLSFIGHIADYYWRMIAQDYPHVTVNDYIIMPNHMHGIVCIGESPNVQTPARASLPSPFPLPRYGHRPSWKPGCLGSILNHYKSTCTRMIRAIGRYDFVWQPRFHDHIIRNDTEYARIRRYIQNNPMNAGKDALAGVSTASIIQIPPLIPSHL